MIEEMTLGPLLQTIKRDRLISSVELADRLPVPIAVLDNWLRDRDAPTDEQIGRLGIILSTHESHLIAARERTRAQLKITPAPRNRPQNPLRSVGKLASQMASRFRPL